MQPLCEDGEDLDFLMKDVVDGFGLRRPGEQYIYDGDPLRTVSDIFALVRRSFAGRIGAPGLCMTSMAFYRLRAAISRERPDCEVRPLTPLTTLVGGNPRHFLRRLGEGSQLAVPGLAYGWMSGLGLLAFLAFFVAVGFNAFALAVFLAAAAMLLFMIDPGKLPSGCSTVGDLVQAVVALNYGRLADQGGAIRDDQLRDALIRLLKYGSAAEEIDLQTPLFEAPRRRG